MPVPLTSADLSQPGAGDALGAWEQVEVATPRIHVSYPSTLTTTEAAASESDPPAVPLSDAELLAAFVQRRDADAFTEIVQRYRLLVYRVALRAVDDRHLADDVFQATFLVLARSAHKIKRGEALAAWLHGTTRNIARRALATQYTEQKQLADWAKQTLAQKGEEMATSTEADPFEELTRRHEQQLLDEELQQLPEASRAPLVLFYLEQKSQPEIAQLMGLSVEAVEGRLKRAKQELRTRLIRRGVLLSTVVAAATVLTPAITAAAPTATLVSATITTALGTAALGSTALGATAVTGAATSSKLAAGSATATTLAAQEIALMSATSKATAMLITTAASTTLISGLVLGAMVGTFSMGARGSAPSDELSLTELAIPQEINGEALGPGLLSPDGEELVQIALVEPEETKESEKPALAQAEKVETPNEVKPIVYSVADLSAEQLVKAAESAVSLAADISLHESTQSLVIRATQENHKQIARQLQALRSQHSPWMSDQFRLVLASGRLATLMKEFGENHPKVKEAQRAIATLERAIADQSRRAMPSEKVKNDSEQSTAQTETSDLSNRPVLTSYEVGDLSAEELLDVGEYAMSIADLREVRMSDQCIIVSGTLSEVQKISKHIEELRNKSQSQTRDKFKPLLERLMIAKSLKQFEENHPDVKQARNEIAAIEKSIAEGTNTSRIVEEHEEQLDSPLVTTVPERGGKPAESPKPDSTKEPGEFETRLYTIADIDADLQIDIFKALQLRPSVSVYRDADTDTLFITAPTEELAKIHKQYFQHQMQRQVAYRMHLLSSRTRDELSQKRERLGNNDPEVKRLQRNLVLIEEKARALLDEQKGKDQLASTSEDKETPNELRAVAYSLEGIGAGNLQKIIEFAESNSDSVSFHTGTHSLVIRNTPENHHKFADYVSQIKSQQETDLKHQFEIIAARKSLDKKVKELGEDHPEVRKAQAEVSKRERTIIDQTLEALSAGKAVKISTTIFEADDAALRQIADKDAQGRLILLQDSRKKFNSLRANQKVVAIEGPQVICRIGPPNNIFTGGEWPLEPLPKDGVGAGQKVESVRSGTQLQLTIFDKRANNGQRVLKYDLESSLTHSGDNNPHLDGRELPVVSGRVFRGYVPLPEKESQGALIGPVGSVERNSTEGVLRYVSTYLWIRAE